MLLEIMMNPELSLKLIDVYNERHMEILSLIEDIYSTAVEHVVDRNLIKVVNPLIISYMYSGLFGKVFHHRNNQKQIKWHFILQEM